AVCHRDSQSTSHAQVRWHDDRLVFVNPGGLPPPLRPERLKEQHASHPRNRKLAEMLYYAGLIEQWGSGIDRMVRECAGAGLPEPEFEDDGGWLWVTFRKERLTEEYLRSLGLNERQVRAVLHIREHLRLTNAEY